MNVSRSKHYYKSKKDTRKDSAILEAIKAVATDFPSYGYRRITAALAREGMVVNHKKVYRIMSQNGILCSIRRSYKHTTNSNHDMAKYPNLVKNLVPVRLNQVWHADITYLRFTDLIHHSDQGFQYCSSRYIEILKENGIVISMSDKANPYDNAKMESFFRTLKVEEVYMGEYNTYEDVLFSIPYFIEEVYNKKRLHSSLGYMPPEEFEEKFNKNKSHQLALI